MRIIDSDTLFFDLPYEEGNSVVAGVDEAGRGPLAGPVVSAAVILNEDLEHELIKDSKQLTEKARELAFSFICENAISVGIGVVSPKFIDNYNILNATLEAMKKAVLNLSPEPDLLLVDGIHRVPVNICQRCIKKGDRKVKSISAASIVAKVYRDRIMMALHLEYPEYGFERNKGYGTKEHLSALLKYGPSPVHRLTFKGVSGLITGE